MEAIGLLALVLILCYSGYPGRVRKLEKKVKQLELQQKGESAMSKLMEELVGRHCRITSDEGVVLVGKTDIDCMVLDCDGEWVKIRYTDRKKRETVRLMRIENISGVELLEEI